jgi:hypothetical protein
MRFIRRKCPATERKSPLKFELASTTEVDKYEFLTAGFFESILGIDRNDCLITDESSLWDFHGERSNEPFQSRILEAYGVDVSDIVDGNLARIFQRIAEANRW